MATQSRKRLGWVLLLLAGLYIMLPVALSLVTSVVKYAQQRVIASHGKASEVFVHFKLSDVAGDIKDGEEFCYNGSFYDVKSIEKESGQYTVYALPDKKETCLAKINATQHDNVGTSSDTKVFPLMFFFYQSPQLLHMPIGVLHPKHAWYYTANAISRCINVNSPPPWLPDCVS